MCNQITLFRRNRVFVALGQELGRNKSSSIKGRDPIGLANAVSQ